MPYLTPNSIPSGTICRTVLIPDDIDWVVIVNGALSELLRAENFEQFGSLTPEEVADRFEQMFFETRDSECPPVIVVGTVVMHAGVTAPALWKRCEGQSLLRATYPDLFTAIGTIYGAADGTHFNLPDFRDRSAIGWNAAATNQGTPAGAMTHAISVAELPSHNHQESVNNNATPAVQLTAGGTNKSLGGAASTITTPLLTQNTGGGTAISLLHPVLPMQFIIYAGV